MPTLPNHPPDTRFDPAGGAYIIKMPSGRWLKLGKADLKEHYRYSGFKVDDFHKKSGLKNFEHACVLIQQNLSVDYAGPLAGYQCGVLECQDGKKVLVTSEASPVIAKRGEAPNFEKFIADLLGPAQAEFFLCWLKIARQSLLEESFRPGQMLALAGPSGCGKSLLQSLITALLGGRMAKPYLYMTGGTAFNSHLAAAEHLVIADENASMDLRSRRAFGAAIKDLCVNREMSIHAKGRDITVCVPTFRRVTLSVNDEPENLAILPPMDDSILDKIALLRCSPTNVGTNPIQIWKSFASELPAVCWQCEQMRVPKTKLDSRYGVKAYHNPDLIGIVAEISPEARLLGVIDEVLFPEEQIRDTWKGNSMELEKVLRASAFGFVVDKLFSFASACGTYLARLKSKFPERFQNSTSKGKTVWTILK